MPSAFMNYGVTGRQQDGAPLQQEEKNKRILFAKRPCCAEAGSSDQRKRCLKNLKDYHSSFSALLGALARVNFSVPKPYCLTRY